MEQPMQNVVEDEEVEVEVELPSENEEPKTEETPAVEEPVEVEEVTEEHEQEVAVLISLLIKCVKPKGVNRQH